MSDQNEQEPAVTEGERVKREVAEVFGRLALVDAEGKVDPYRIADLIQPAVVAAVVEKPTERATVGVPTAKLIEDFFPDVDGPMKWADYDEEEQSFRKEVYKAVKAVLLRVLAPQPTGIIQRRLASNGGLVLCRTSKDKGSDEWLAYVTRNYNCVKDDLTQPEIAKAKAALNRAAALSALAMERIPEKARLFEREFAREAKTALNGNESRLKGILEAQNTTNEPDDESDSDG